VTISIFSGPKGVKLMGKTTVNAVDGVADFSGLKLNKLGSYTLKVTSPGLTPDISNVFTVMPKPRPTKTVSHYPKNVPSPTSTPHGHHATAVKPGAHSGKGQH
jgi:hypothetical protein